MRHTRYFFLATSVLWACSGRSESSQLPLVWDSAGVTVSQNPAQPPAGFIWHLGEQANVILGKTEGRGPEVFGSVTKAIGLETGEVAVVDGIARQIRIFDATGRHVASLGREGEGPGEFANLGEIYELAGDTIAAIDNLSARVSLFGPDRHFARSFALPRPEHAAAPIGVGWLSEGLLVVRGLTMPPSRDPRQSSTILLYTVDLEGHLSEMIGEFPHQRLGGNGLPLGFGGGCVTAVGDSLIWVGHTGTFELRAFDSGGSLRRIVRVPQVPRPVTTKDVSEAKASAEESLIRQGATQGVIRRIMATEFAETHPVFGRMWADEVGYLWVAQDGAIPSERSDVGTVSEVWDVFDRDGRLLGTIGIPGGFRVTWIGDTQVIGVHTDEFGVDRVRVYRLDRALKLPPRTGGKSP